MSEDLGKIFISVDHGNFTEDCSVESVRAILPRVRGVYCVLFFGKQRAKTPPIPGLASLSWSAFEFEFNVVDQKSRLSVSLYAQLDPEEEDGVSGGPCDDVILCSWHEDTELLEDGNYERWVNLCANDVGLCRLQLHLRMEYAQRRHDAVGLEDFDQLTAIGEGAFGKVMTVRKCDSGKIYAMKVLEKGRVQSKRQLARMLGERNILMKVQSPFIVGLHYAFQTTDKVYLVLDFVGGGDLFHHLRMQKKFPQECVKFWAAEIVCALDVLHAKSIVYRDLKPENILLEPDGHIVLVDFGLAKQMQNSSVQGVEGRSNSFVGTPEYLAPEVVQGTGHSMSVDWWTLGILLFELLIGKPPFKSKDLSILYQKIVSEDVVVPSNSAIEKLSLDARSLLRGLLCRNPSTRLGAHGGGMQVRAHPFFGSIDWALLEVKKVQPPYTPLSPADYLQKVFCMVHEEPVRDVPPPSAPKQLVAPKKIAGATSPIPSAPSGLFDSSESGTPAVVPDYFNSIVNLIEKWQTRILEIPNMEVLDGQVPSLVLKSGSQDSNGSSRSRESKSDSRRSSYSERCKEARDSKLGSETFIKVPLSPNLTAASKAPTSSLVPDKASQSMLAGLLFGPEVRDLENMLREMQERLLSQQQQLVVQNQELISARAERDLIREQLSAVSKSSSSSGEANSTGAPPPSPNQEDSAHMKLVMEETKSLVALANKMAGVMASNVGPVGDEIVTILAEAQKLMGLARAEQEAIEGASSEANWTDMVEKQTVNLMKEQRSQEKVSRMAKQLSETEDSYMKAMAESQQTLGQLQVERDALLQLASKLEEQARMQSDRESGVIDLLNAKSRECSLVSTELDKVKQSEQDLRAERDALLALVKAQTAGTKQEKDQDQQPEPQNATLPGTPPLVTRQSSWPNPIKWLLHRQDGSGSVHEKSDDDEEDDEEVDDISEEEGDQEVRTDGEHGEGTDVDECTDVESESSGFGGSVPNSPQSGQQFYDPETAPSAQDGPTRRVPKVLEDGFDESVGGTVDERVAALFSNEPPLLVVM